MENVLLIGAEDVRAASNNIASAAHDIRQAAATMDESFRQQRVFMDEWIGRFEVAIASLQTSEAHNLQK